MALLRCLPVVLILAVSIAGDCPAAVRVEQLITDLGADSFSAREEATRLFLEQDPRIIPVVRNLLQTTDDAEVKQRAKRILVTLEERDLDARMQAFKRDIDEKAGIILPGWKQFREFAGNTPATRDLFLDMTRAESKLLLLYDTSPDKVADAIAQRIAEQNLALTIVVNQSRVQQTAKSGSVVTLWYLGGEPQVKLGTEAANGIVRMFHMANLTTQIRERGPLSTVFVRWILREHDPMATMQNMSIASQLELPEAGILAERVVGSSLQPALRVQGLNLLVKAKKKAALPILEKALADEGIAYQFFPNGNQAGSRKEMLKIQFRDLALVQMLGLCEQKPADFGITVPLPTEANQFNVDYQKLVLATDEERETLHKKWRTWWTDHKTEQLPKS